MPSLIIQSIREGEGIYSTIEGRVDCVASFLQILHHSSPELLVEFRSRCFKVEKRRRGQVRFFISTSTDDRKQEQKGLWEYEEREGEEGAECAKTNEYEE